MMEHGVLCGYLVEESTDVIEVYGESGFLTSGTH